MTKSTTIKKKKKETAEPQNSKICDILTWSIPVLISPIPVELKTKNLIIIGAMKIISVVTIVGTELFGTHKKVPFLENYY